MISKGAPGTVDNIVNVNVAIPAEPDTMIVLRRLLRVVVSIRDTTAGRLVIAVAYTADILT